MRLALLVLTFAALTAGIIVPIGLGDLRIAKVEVADSRPCPALPRERCASLPPWFGRRHAEPVTLRGVVHARTLPTSVHLGIDVPDPGIWTGRDVDTDADGRFELTGLRPGAYLLQAYGPGEASRVVKVEIDVATPVVDLYAYACDPVDGIVLAGELPVAHASLEIAGRAAAISDRDGKFQLCGLVEDVVAIIHADGFAPIARTIREGAFSGRMESYVSAGTVIDGTLAFVDGTELTGIGITARRSGMHGQWPSSLMIATTDAHGRFHFDGLPSGRYRFDVVGADDSTAALLPSTTYDLRGGAQFVELTEWWGDRWPRTRSTASTHRNDLHLRGQVVRAGLPIADAEVSVDGSMDLLDLTAHTHPDGRFELAVPPGYRDAGDSLTISARSRRGDLRGRIRVEGSSGTAFEDVTIVMGPGVEVSGIVVDPEGVPIAGASLEPGGHHAEFWRREPTDSHGAFRFLVPFPARTRLHVRALDGSELLAPLGSILPRLDVDSVDGRIEGLRVVVERGPAKIRAVVVGGSATIAPERWVAAAVRGRVIAWPEGGPVAGARCSTLDLPRRAVVETTSRVDGTFELEVPGPSSTVRCVHDRMGRNERLIAPDSKARSVVPLVPRLRWVRDIGVDATPHARGARIIAVADEAAAAGVLPDDVLEQIDDVALAGMELEAIRELAFEMEDHTAHTWRVRRDGHVREIRVVVP